MAQRQWRSDDTSAWTYGFGSGSDGTLSISSDTTDAPIDSACTGTATQTSLTATNVSFAAGQLILIHQTRGTGVGNWELNKIQSYTAGTITLTDGLINTYETGAQVLVLKQYTTVTVDSAKTLTAKAWNGTVGGIIAFLAKTSTTITGTISVAGKGYVGGSAAANGQGYSGEGTVGASVQQQSANGNGGGGGAADNAQGGGGGGHSTAGSAGTRQNGGSGGAGGGTGGLASLITAIPGGGGGQGRGSTMGLGGAGGGFLLIISKAITVTGSVNIKGVIGWQGVDGGDGGSGGGGSALFKGETIVLGTNLVDASGAAGSTTNPWGANGGAGGTGRIHADYSVSISGTTTPTIDSTQDVTIKDSGGFIPKFIFF